MNYNTEVERPSLNKLKTRYNLRNLKGRSVCHGGGVKTKQTQPEESWICDVGQRGGAI